MIKINDTGIKEDTNGQEKQCRGTYMDLQGRV
jgi:hypothetical protein